MKSSDMLYWIETNTNEFVVFVVGVLYMLASFFDKKYAEF